MAWRHVAGTVPVLAWAREDSGLLPEPHPPPPAVRAGRARAYLVVPVFLQEVAGHVAGQDVAQHVLVVFPQLLHLVDLLLRLNSPEEVQAGRVLQLQFR